MAPALVCCVLILSARSLLADARADEKTRVQFSGTFGKVVNFFGGKAAREGVAATTAVKGSRRIRINDSAGQIVDLSEEKIYDLDVKKKTYKVTTFDEMRRRLEEAQKRAREDAAKAPDAKEEPAAQDPDAKEVEVDFDVQQTGQAKMLNGFNVRQAVMTITVREKGRAVNESGGLIVTSDVWLAPRIDAMQEIAEFEIKYAQQLYGPVVAGASEQDMATALALYPMLKPALARLATEAQALDGTPISTTTTMDAVKSAEQLAEEQRQSDEASAPSGKGLGGLLGGLAKKAAKKDEGPKARATFMTITHEVLKVASDVSDAQVAVPAGFREAK
jgi:hypothetical protein